MPFPSWGGSRGWGGLQLSLLSNSSSSDLVSSREKGENNSLQVSAEGCPVPSCPKLCLAPEKPCLRDRGLSVLLGTVINKSCSVWPEGQQQLHPTRGLGAQWVMSAVGVWGEPPEAKHHDRISGSQSSDRLHSSSLPMSSIFEVKFVKIADVPDWSDIICSLRGVSKHA